jgi:hypothetical protein
MNSIMAASSYRCAFVAQCLAGQQGEHRAQALAAGGDDVFRHLADENYIGMQARADDAVYGLHVFSDQGTE